MAKTSNLEMSLIDKNSIITSNLLNTNYELLDEKINALLENSKIILGSYTGTGTVASENNPDVQWYWNVNLGYQPKAVIVFNSEITTNNSYNYDKHAVYFATPDNCAIRAGDKWGSYDTIVITDTGFKTLYCSNSSGLQCKIGYGTHYYLVLK